MKKGIHWIVSLNTVYAYVRKHDYEVHECHIYREVMTGFIYRERPELSKMRAAARNREFDIVVIYDFDRLAREDTHQTVIIQDLKENGVELKQSDETLKIPLPNGFSCILTGLCQKWSGKRYSNAVKTADRCDLQMENS